MIIAHDLGTTGNKATLVDRLGQIIDVATTSYETDFGMGGKAEQDPEAWWQAVCEATRRLLKSVPNAGLINCVSFSGQMMGAVFLDGSSEPVRPAIIWADTRSSAQAGQLVERVGMRAAYAITGHRLNPTYSLSKVMWVRNRNEPGTFARIRHVVQAKDFIVYRLTDALFTDPSDASSTNAFDQATGTWSDEILDAASLDAALLPDIVPSTTVVGTVSRAAAWPPG